MNQDLFLDSSHSDQSERTDDEDLPDPQWTKKAANAEEMLNKDGVNIDGAGTGDSDGTQDESDHASIDGDAQVANPTLPLVTMHRLVNPTLRL